MNDALLDAMHMLYTAAKAADDRGRLKTAERLRSMADEVWGMCDHAALGGGDVATHHG